MTEINSRQDWIQKFDENCQLPEPDRRLISELATSEFIDLMEIALEYPNDEFWWSEVSKNPHISWNYIIDDLDQPFRMRLPWNMRNLVSREDAPSEYFIRNAKNPHIQWNSREDWIQIAMDNSQLPKPIQWLITKLAMSKFIDLDWIIVNHPESESWWNGVSMNPHISWDYIMDNLEEFPWNFTNLVSREDAPLEFFIANARNPDIQWNWNFLTKSPKIPWQTIVENWDLPWNLNEIIRRKDVDWDFVLSQDEEIWDWRTLSYNVPFEVLRDNPDRPWVYEWVQNVTWEYVSKHPDKDWNLNRVGLNQIDFHRYKDQLQSHREKYYWLPWDNIDNIALVQDMEDRKGNDMLRLYKESGGPPWDLIIAHPEIDWDYPRLVVNYKVSSEIIRQIPKLQEPNYMRWFSEESDLQDIVNNPDLPWRYDLISERDDFDQIDPQVILDNPRAGWKWSDVKKVFSEIMDEFLMNA